MIDTLNEPKYRKYASGVAAFHVFAGVAHCGIMFLDDNIYE
jgi:hypothetical protein